MSNWSLVFSHIGGYLDHSPPGLTILWTIAVEQQIYLILPLMAVLFWRGFGPILVIGCFVIAIAARLLFPISTMMWNTYYNTLSYLDVVALGCAAGYAFQKYHNTTVRIFHYGIPTLIMGAAYYWLHGLGFQIVKLAWLYWIVGTFYITLILYFVTNQQSILARIFSSKPFAYLGKISFGIYVWHVTANAAANIIVSNLGIEGKSSAMTSLVITLALCFTMADGTYRLIEYPMNKIRHRKSLTS